MKSYWSMWEINSAAAAESVQWGQRITEHEHTNKIYQTRRALGEHRPLPRPNIWHSEH